MMDYTVARRRMVEQHIIGRGVEDQRVIQAMLQVPRHCFVEPGLQSHAYGDGSLPIGEKQTISQPYIVAVMTASLGLSGSERILEIGTGSGYQTAILARLAKRVYSVERIASLASRARRILDQLNLYNINIKIGDDTVGWKEQAPFDGILVAAGGPEVPDAYLQQLDIGGRLVMPVGDRDTQVLVRFTRTDHGYIKESLMDCRFVPLIGQSGWSTDTF
jgi:protein-L-isoaspartate(D-aspartate) O-methyltransferase